MTAWERALAWTHIHRRALGWGAVGLVLSPFLLVIGLAVVTPFPAELEQPVAASVRVLSRDGELLREVRTDDGARARPLAPSEYPERVRDAVLAAEDRRFYQHPGVDVIAVARALVSDVAHRHVVSGASTLTMQLARTLRPHRRTPWGKITEAALALRIEARLPKERILTEYLNRVSYGPNLRGFGAASQAYFAEPPAALSVAQTALVAGLPRGPSIYDVVHHPDRARQRRDRVLRRMRDDGMIDAAAEQRALDEPLVTAAAHLVRPAFGAPHFVRALLQGQLAHEQPGLADALAGAHAMGTLEEIETTLDPELQRATEAAVGRAVHELAGQNVTAGAALVVDNATGDVLAYVGSPDFFDEEAEGQNDGVTALRQPGSSLKPFVYAEAMETLGYTAATVLPDVELHIPLPGGGDYVPHDYDTRLRGPVRLREALGNSLNVPAVYTLYQLGTARVLERYHAMGFASLRESAETYGPALALGDGEVTLVEIARAYSTLARGGEARPLRFVTHVTTSASGDALVDFAPGALTRVLGEKTALVLGDILSDKGARLSAFGDQNALEFDFDVAAKTGTSKGYRDNIAAGFTRAVTVVAWAGNFDGSPMRDVSGIAGAGPIFHAVMEAAMQGRPRDPSSSSLSLGATSGAQTVAARLGLERTAICPLSGMVATSACPHHVQEWLAIGEAFHAPPCTVHEPARINLHDGLLAGPGCPERDTETRVFERWTAPYDAWATQTSRVTLPTGSSPECPVAADDDAAPGEAGDADAPRVTYPFDGSRFVVDPERARDHQLLDVRVDSGGRPFTVTVDGVPLPAPYTWPLAEGRHEIVAHATGTGNRPSKTVVIQVR